jgi:hypothetical protein
MLTQSAALRLELVWRGASAVTSRIDGGIATSILQRVMAMALSLLKIVQSRVQSTRKKGSEHTLRCPLTFTTKNLAVNSQ